MLGKFAFALCFMAICLCCISAWDEIYEVFGDGHDYDWALADDDEAMVEEEHGKPDMKYQDVRLLISMQIVCRTHHRDVGFRTIRNSSSVAHRGR